MLKTGKASDPGLLRFQDDDITDTRLVETRTVVDHQNVAGRRSFKRLEKDINAPNMPNRPRATGASHSRKQRLYARRSKTYGNAGPQTAIREIRRG
jgi:hypothetical protein